MTLRTRFKVEIILALASSLTAAMTLFRPDWIEALFGRSPDGGSGGLERGLAALLLLTTVTFTLQARRTRLMAREL